MILLLPLLAFPVFADVEMVLRLDKNKILLGDTAALEISVSGSSGGLGEPKIVIPSELSVYSQSKSQKVEVVNWQMTTSVVYTLLLSASKPGVYNLGPAKIDAGGGQSLTSNAVTLEVVDQKNPQVPGAPQGLIKPFAVPNFPRSTQQMLQDKKGRQERPAPGPQPQQSPQTQKPQDPTPPLVFIEAKADKKQAYTGEAVKFSVLFYTRVPFLSQPQYIPPNTSGFWQEELPQATYQANIKGLAYQVTEIPLTLFPTAPGKLKVGSAKIQLELDRGDMGSLDPFDPQFFQRFFGMGAGETHLLQTEPVEITALPLPEDIRPKDFSGAVGQFTIEASLDKNNLKVGESLVLTVTISGEGNIRSLPSPLYPNLEGLFRNYETEKSETVSKQGGKITGAKTYKLLLIPQVPGNPSLTIPPIRFVYFDPKAKGYMRRQTQALSAEVTGEPMRSASANAANQDAPDAKQFANDIQFIIEDLPRPSPWRRSLKEMARLWLPLAGVPVLCWLSAVSVAALKEKRRTRQSHPMQRLTLAIAQAGDLAPEGKPAALAGVLTPALENAIRQALSLSVDSSQALPAAITKAAQGKLPPEEISFLRQTMETLNYLRFAPVRKEEVQELLAGIVTDIKKAKQILEKL